MRQAMLSNQTGQREGLLKYRLGKKEKEYVDIKDFRLILLFFVFKSWKIV